MKTHLKKVQQAVVMAAVTAAAVMCLAAGPAKAEDQVGPKLAPRMVWTFGLQATWLGAYELGPRLMVTFGLQPRVHWTWKRRAA